MLMNADNDSPVKDGEPTIAVDLLSQLRKAPSALRTPRMVVTAEDLPRYQVADVVVQVPRVAPAVPKTAE
ncbi:hypothetical protein A2U01_0036294 [Trifolium medium]|uniref:Uncharacterized protein n=1 Tax=Trifolium medium TaxID=97028 RepID=A0A392PSS9_9FABA|nr:hypothetical protein [Trifolium medium]